MYTAGLKTTFQEPRVLMFCARTSPNVCYSTGIFGPCLWAMGVDLGGCSLDQDLVSTVELNEKVCIKTSCSVDY